MNLRLTAFAFLYCIAVAVTVGAEPPNENIAAEVMREKWVTPPDLTSWLIFEIEGDTKSERLNRSGVELYEINRAIPGFTDMMPDPGSIPGFGDGTGVAEYKEAVKVEIDGETKSFDRTVPPEEIGRRKVEAGGMTREQFADFLEMYSTGLLAVGEAFRQELPGIGFFGGYARSVGSQIDDAPMAQPNVESAWEITGFCAIWGV